MQGYHYLGTDNWDKIFIDWFTKCSGGYIVYIR